MKLIKISIFLLLCFVFVKNAKASSKLPAIDSINSFFVEISNTNGDIDKEKINDNLINYFIKFLENGNSFSANFSELNFVTVLKSDDNKLNVFTWNLAFKTGKLKYYGFLQYKKNNKILVYFLQDMKYYYEDEDLEDVTNALYGTNTEWFGAIYYEIITKKYQSQTYYTLLGWDGANLLINRKIIEVLHFGRKDLPLFGGKVFKKEKNTANKFMFEFSEKATMLLRYNKQIDMIVFDHLAPYEDKFAGLPQFYGPDYSYDAFFFDKGKWVYNQNIDANLAIPYEKNKMINFLKKRNFSINF
ncbi:MAG: hypothetical protein LBV69_01920 [Bacteroidales bacterium]|jgi:hypothetical protein|nr:hypothetical protein [Bacteroidales bacterium]